MAGNLLQEPVEARVSASIGSMATRAADTQWAAGDAIGITGGGYTNIRYVYSNGSWTVDDVSGPILFQTPDDVDFIAYYPQGAETADITITAGQQSTVPDEQTGFTPQSQIDFLYGTHPAVADRLPLWHGHGRCKHGR